MDGVTATTTTTDASNTQASQQENGELNGRDVVAYENSEAAAAAGCGIACCGLSLGCCV